MAGPAPGVEAPSAPGPAAAAGGGSRERGGRPGEGPELAESRAGGSPASRESPVPPERRSLQGLGPGCREETHGTAWASTPCRGATFGRAAARPQLFVKGLIITAEKKTLRAWYGE